MGQTGLAPLAEARNRTPPDFFRITKIKKKAMEKGEVFTSNVEQLRRQAVGRKNVQTIVLEQLCY